MVEEEKFYFFPCETLVGLQMIKTYQTADASLKETDFPRSPKAGKTSRKHGINLKEASKIQKAFA